MRRRQMLTLAVAGGLAGCAGGRRHGLELPLLSVQGLNLAADGAGDTVTLLVRHFGKRPVRVTGLRLDLLLLGETVSLEETLDLPLPPQAQEAVTVALRLPKPLRADLLQVGGDRGTELAIRGSVAFGLSQQPVRYDGRIAPVPGRPGQFR